MTFMKQLVPPLIEAGWVSRDSVRGCTDGEITHLMERQGVTTLPEAYREFMRYGGRDPYWLNRDGEWDYDWLLEAKDIAREIVVDDYQEDFTPFENCFVFQTHQGYSFFYFRAEDLDREDPEFWVYVAQEPVRSIGVRFSEWVRQWADYLPRAIEIQNQLHRGSGGN